MLQERKRSGGWVSKMAELLGMTTHLERRDRPRLRANFRAILSGDCGQLEVRGMDASRLGVGVLSPEAVRVGTLVFIRLQDFGLTGFGSIRHCVAQGEGSFALGLQFRGELSHEDFECTGATVQRFTEHYGVWDAASEFPAH